MKELEGRMVEVLWCGADAARQRFRLLEARPGIGFVKLCRESAGGDCAADEYGFWVAIEAIRELVAVGV